ncbi:hypothetical protein HPP92_002806 [Vanilla planifolia]|uniref:CBS domain-containing protein n=1 Tax=Vanilla planifolia TaxID=51239 RepID=A0A835VJA4_VANPL|nr:hypothetical protein HPP92_002806 [Vanilla planifolia]
MEHTCNILPKVDLFFCLNVSSLFLITLFVVISSSVVCELQSGTLKAFTNCSMLMQEFCFVPCGLATILLCCCCKAGGCHFVVKSRTNLSALNFSLAFSSWFSHLIQKHCIFLMLLIGRLVDALEMMKQGVQRLLVRKSIGWKGVSKRFSILYNGKWLKNCDSSAQQLSFALNEGSYCCLSQEDVVRFIIGCLGALAPIPLSSITSLCAINNNYCFIEASSPALNIVNNFPQDPCAVAVVETTAVGTRKIIGEISGYKLWKCDYLSAAWAMANLSAGQFVMGLEDDAGDPLPELKVASQTDGGIAESPRPRKFSSRNVGFFSNLPVGGLRSTRSMYRGRSAPLTCRQTSSLAAVMAQMLSHRATHVWVTESDSAENTLVGVVSYVDILCAVTKTPATSVGSLRNGASYHSKAGSDEQIPKCSSLSFSAALASPRTQRCRGRQKPSPQSHSSLQRTPGRRRRVIYAATPPSIINLPCRSLFRYSFRSPQSPKDAHTIVNSLAKSVRKTLTVAIFTAAFALVPFPGGRIFPAIATPTVVEKNEKGETLTDHEFSGYTRRLLSVVSVLLRRIEDVKSVKANKRKIQDEVIGNLNAELKELKTAKMELIRRSEEVLDLALAAMKEEGWLLRNDEQNKRPRELSFIEKESELLVQSFSRWMVEFKHGRKSLFQKLFVFICFMDGRNGVNRPKANLKKQLLENINHGRQYLVQRQEHILLDRERLVAKTWYNDERKRWEMDPVAVPYAVSKKLMESARIRFDWAVMYVTLKGDDKEYFVDIKEFDLLFEDFGGFDGLYMRMIASGIRTVVQLMWIPLSDLDMHQQYLLIKSLSYQCLFGIWKSPFISQIKEPFFSSLKNTAEDIFVIVVFPILEFIIPKQVRMSIGMAWPEEAHQAVDSTWYLKWQCEAEVRHRARKRDSFIWYLWFFIKSYVYVVVLFNVIQFLWKVPWLLGHGGLRRKDPNLRKLRRLVVYLRYKRQKYNFLSKRDRDPIRSVFNQMKRVKNPPIPLSEFSIVESLRDEINDIVTFLQNPRAFSERGARAPGGVLIVGEPETGKTSLALAIAAEAKVPVVEVKASQLERKGLVGQSASNVRELFKAARDLAPVIIFVEDFELFAGVRGKFIHTENQDHEAFINQLLVELDGFENQDGVVLLATTNNLKQIDEALRRPGRMDRVLRLQRLTQMEREKILHLAAKETMDHDLIDFVDWKKVAEKTAMLKPVQLKYVPIALEGSAFRNKRLDMDELWCYCTWFATAGNIIPTWLRQTKLFKLMSKRLVEHLGLTLTKEDMQSVVDLMEPYGQIRDGIEYLGPPADWTREEKFAHAVWAAGRGLMALLLPNYDVVECIWLQPCSWEGIGCTKITKARSNGTSIGNLESRSYLEKKIVFCFASCVAAQLLLPFGEENFLSSHETKQAQEIATRMVLHYGWGPDDSPAIYVANKAFRSLTMGTKHEVELAAKVEGIYTSAYEKAREMLQKNFRILQIIVDQLLESESLNGEDLINILEENGGIREVEPFTLSKHQYKKNALERPLDSNVNAAVVALLDVKTK